MVEREGEREDALSRHQIVGGLEARDPAEAGGIADRPAGIGAQASGTKPAASAAPEPEDDPPGWQSVFQGLRANGNGSSFHGPPNANSCNDSLPSTIAPAARKWPITCASARAILSTMIFEWQVVGRPAMSILSLMPTGTPCSGPRARPAQMSFSACRAASSAPSASTLMKAAMRASCASIRSISAATSSTGESRRVAYAEAISVAVSQCRSFTARS